MTFFSPVNNWGSQNKLKLDNGHVVKHELKIERSPPQFIHQNIVLNSPLIPTWNHYECIYLPPKYKYHK